VREDWKNFRAAWNAEAKRITQKVLGEKIGFSDSYVSKLGGGDSLFTEEIIEGFSQHMRLPLSVLFSDVAQSIPSKEAEEMRHIKEMVQVMLASENIKLILLGKFTELKMMHAQELGKKKLPNVLCKNLD
jgi:hypothetical protein